MLSPGTVNSVRGAVLGRVFANNGGEVYDFPMVLVDGESSIRVQEKLKVSGCVKKKLPLFIVYNFEIESRCKRRTYKTKEKLNGRRTSIDIIESAPSGSISPSIDP